MPGCCAWGCRNRTEKGSRMYRFPSDPQRKQVWAAKVSRLGWKPQITSRLCEEHFDAKQFERIRIDGKKKLIANAIPTIFVHRKIQKLRSSPFKRSVPIATESSDEDEGVQPSRTVHIDHNYCLPPQQKSELHETKGDSCALTDHHTPVGKVKALQCKVKGLQGELKQVRRQNLSIVKRKRRQENVISKLLAMDQLIALGRKNMKGIQWSSSTVKKAMQLRFACGPTGYDLLLKQNFPLPSTRTIQRRMACVPFRPGVLEKVFDYLKIKADSMTEEEKICSLTLDEMSISPNVEYDSSSGRLLGNVTLPGHTGVATHGLVFMLGGVTSRWKQTIAYHYTSNSTNGEVFKPIILDIITRCASIGLHVIAVTSDMGSANRAMWRSFGIVCGKNCRTMNKIPHPCHQNKSLYFLADVPHVIKNIKAALINGQLITLAKDTISGHSLVANEVNIEHVKDLAQFQEEKDLKLAPNLHQMVLTPTHFDKMKVSNALNLFSHSVSAALHYLVENEGYERSFLTTAWFLELCNHWFNLMSSRHPVMALSRMQPEKYNEAIAFLLEVVKTFKTLKIGKNDVWKPVQTGVVLSTTSVLELAEELLDSGHKFLLTSRLTQDCLENLFSSVRLKNPVPSPLEFKFALKIISISQFLKTSRTGSYFPDDNDFLVDLCQPALNNSEPVIDGIELSNSGEDLCEAEKNSLFYLAGYCVSKLKKNDKHCKACLGAVECPPVVTSSVINLTKLKDYKGDCLSYVTEDIFKMVISVELMFRGLEENTLFNMNNLRKAILDKAMLNSKNIILPECHSIKEKLLKRFINVRLQIFCKKIRNLRKSEISYSNKGGELGSKSMAMRKLVKRLK